MSKANDLTGRTFGLLKVLRRVEDVKPGRPMWLCECRCGKSVVKSSTSLTKQNGVKSCGCLRHQKSPELIDLTDMTFGDLRVLYQDCSAQSGKARWVCQCGCGNVVSGSLRKSAPLQNDILRLQMPSLEIRSGWSRIWLSQSD